MKILFIGAEDHANWGHNYCAAINKFTSWEAKIITFAPHGFYNHNFKRIDELTQADNPLSHGDWVFLLGAGRYDLCEHALQRLDPRWYQNYRPAIRHPGSYFRENQIICHNMDDQWGMLARFYHPQLYQFAAAHPRSFPYLHIAHDCASFVSLKEKSGDFPLTIHCPSNQRTKGTHWVLHETATSGRIKQLHKLKFADLQKERAKAHYILDQWNYDLNSFGSSAVESSALGCVPILNKLGKPTLEALEVLNVPPPPFVQCEPENILEEIDNKTTWRIRAEENVRWSMAHTSPEVRAKDLIARLEFCK